MKKQIHKNVFKISSRNSERECSHWATFYSPWATQIFVPVMLRKKIPKSKNFGQKFLIFFLLLRYASHMYETWSYEVWDEKIFGFFSSDFPIKISQEFIGLGQCLGLGQCNTCMVIPKRRILGVKPATIFGVLQPSESAQNTQNVFSNIN